jgi:hypothetical protein
MYDIAVEQGIINDNFWLHRKVVPNYTYEHSFKKLAQMRMRLIMTSQWNKSKLGTIKFILDKVFSNFGLFIKNIKNVVE